MATGGSSRPCQPMICAFPLVAADETATCKESNDVPYE